MSIPVKSNNGIDGNACVFQLDPPALCSFFDTPDISVEFIGYLLLGTQPTLYPLYCPPAGLIDIRGFLLSLQPELTLVTYLSTLMIHSPVYESLDLEVPVYVLVLRTTPTPFLNLPWIRGRTGSDDMVHGVYDHAGVAHVDEPETIIHLAQHPSGYYIPDVENSVSSSSILPPTSQFGSSVIASTTGTETGTGTGTAMLGRPKKVQAEHSLHQIMETCLNWHRALAYLRVQLRIAICCGHSDNPHVLVSIDYAERRLELIRSCWPDCLVRANVAPEALETVFRKDSKVPMTHAEASPWITQFLYDNHRIVAYSMDDPRIFGLGNFFGLAQRHSIMILLQMFTRPSAHLLPIKTNGFATFITHQIAEEMLYHIVFRTTTTSRIRLTIADLEPAIFRHASSPPADTLALAGSCCYQALLVRLISMWGIADVMPDYPTAVQVHTELRETAMMLFQAEDDPDIVSFKAELRTLCTITETDVFRIGRPTRAGKRKGTGQVLNLVEP
ncbi:uncharacterized protein HD556DRAFT_1443421 [Suillus plorans]|uniref:Uncharacterized protein n=1 Tax=Suillus plorans TaxID=116603 RepID=A0A9P7AQP8_9AGAM|nr:uncharacterized protein HD556DRAFT_1443421 [Suillus plorans]KAG1793634.1 hypothetical protein HD556DRAFT_1443421 [Suillus plorans]